jgi:hypothetical protein
MRRLATGAAAALIVAMPAAAIAQAPREDCATYADLQAVSSFALPGTIDAIAAKCRTSLGAKAYLRTSGPALSARLRASGASWEEASPAFTKISRLSLGSNGGEFASGAVVEQLVSGAVTEAFETSNCKQIDSGIGALATLPPSRMVDMLATFFVAVSGEMGLTMCRAD